MLAKNFTFGLIGASKTGLSIAKNLEKAGCQPKFVWNRSKTGLERARNYVDFEKFTTQINDLPHANGYIISVSDDSIQLVAKKLSETDQNLKDIVIFHTSGFHSSKSLEILQKKGAITGSLHPVISIPNIESGIDIIPETVFTCEGPAAEQLNEIGNLIGRKAIIINRKQKQYIHLSAVFINNYSTVMIAAIKNLMQDKGLDPGQTEDILKKLSKQAADTWHLPIHKALTGPIVRKDLKTIQGHIKLLDNYPDLKELYRAFGKLTADLHSAELQSIGRIFDKESK